MKIEPGVEVGEFELLQLMGRGALGEVWVGERKGGGGLQAIKLLPEKLAQDEFFRSSFNRRAEVMAALKHPRLVKVRSYGRHDGGFYIVMDYVEGPEGPPLTLAEYVSKRGGRLSESETRRFLLQIMEGLDYAHKQGSPGSPHLDLKPHNILIDAKGDVRISDLGMVRLVTEKYLRSRIMLVAGKRGGLPSASELDFHAAPKDGAQPRPQSTDDEVPLPVARPRSHEAESIPAINSWLPHELKTSRAAISHTHDYLSPEQKEKHSGDYRSDIYALGIMAYEFLTGDLPGDKAPPPSRLAPSIPKSWDHFVAKCMEPLPEKRPANIGQAIAMLMATGPFAELGAPRLTDDGEEEGADSPPPRSTGSVRPILLGEIDSPVAAIEPEPRRRFPVLALLGVILLGLAALAVALAAGVFGPAGQSFIERIHGGSGEEIERAAPAASKREPDAPVPDASSEEPAPEAPAGPEESAAP